MSRLARDGTAEPVSRDQILRRERGLGKNHVSCSADHEQDWQPYPVDPYSIAIPGMCDHTYINIYTYDIYLVLKDAFSQKSQTQTNAPAHTRSYYSTICDDTVCCTPVPVDVQYQQIFPTIIHLNYLCVCFSSRTGKS